MEAGARHGRTKSAAAIEGNLHSQRHKSVPAQSSYGRAISTENLLLSSSKQGSGMPIKKLLAQEMVKENETRRKQPSVIARLMGLDGLPSPQPSLKQQRKLLEKNVKQTTSTDLPQKVQYFEDRPSKIDSVDQQDFKDVYEDMEASHVMNHRCSSRWTANSRLQKPDMAHLQQKFTRNKCHPSCERLNGGVPIIDSSNELLLKYLEHPDVLFLKHYYTLQDDPSSSPYDYISSLVPSNSFKHQGCSKVQKLTRDGAYRRDIAPRKRADGLLLQSHKHQSSRNHWQPSPDQANVKDDMNAPTTRIVVLKPNVGKRMNAARLSSPESSHASSPSMKKSTRKKESGTGDTLSCRKKNSSRKEYSSKSTSRERVDGSKESTRKTNKHFKPSSGLRGYAGDDSSYDACESDSSSASEVMITSSRNSFDGSDLFRSSSSGPFESVVSKEARKRLSERWKMAYKSHSLEPSAKVSTLGEMLAVPEKDRIQKLDDGTAPGESSERFLGDGNIYGWDGPRGISSRDGWKEGYIRNSSYSRSLPHSVGNKSHKTSDRHETGLGDRVTKEKDIGKVKSRKGKVRKDGDFSEKDDILSNFESDPCLDKFVDNSGSSQDVSSCQIQTDFNFYGGVQHESIYLHAQAPHLAGSSGCFASDLPKNAEPEPLPLSSNPFADLCPKHDDSFISADGSPVVNQEEVALEESVLVQSEAKSASFESCGLELESYESSKEADYCSPVSVLEVSFPEDVSCSPDSFETVNAKIKKLRNELQLLKLESGGSTDHMLLSNNQDPMQHQPEMIFEEEQSDGDDTWEFSYIDDVLLFSSLEDFDPNTSNFASWHSPECPIGPWVFNSLEKKYTDERTELKSERRLLFDLMNAALLEMFQQYVSRSHSLHPLMIGVPKWQRHGIREHLQEMLFDQENTVNKEKREILLDREMNWLGFRDSVETIGEDIEKLLIDDLIEELLTV